MRRMEPTLDVHRRTEQPRHRSVTRGRVPLVLAAFTFAALAACAHQPPPVGLGHVPGFLAGLGHGLVAPIAFVASIFTDVRIYAFPNIGVWYDFGFLLGVSAWGGGLNRMSFAAGSSTGMALPLKLSYWPFSPSNAVM